jgi:hypothetical protein
MLGESKRGAQNQSMVPSMLTSAAGGLEVSDQAVIGDQGVLRHRCDPYPADSCDHAESVAPSPTSPTWGDCPWSAAWTMLQRFVARCSEAGEMDQGASAAAPSKALRRVLAPLALAQFICSFAGSNMNGLITSAISWRAAFIFQALIIAVIVS